MSLAAFAWLAWAASARAGGFAVSEQGARALGLAGAAVAHSDDASAVFHNPAGLGLLKNKQLSLGAALVHAGTDFEGLAPFPGDGLSETSARGLRTPPAIDYAQRLSQRLVVGFGFHVPFDLRSRWADRETTYSGRFLVQRAEIRSVSLLPALAYQLADRLSVGGGVDLRLSRLELDRRVAMFNPFTQRVQDVAALELDGGRSVSVGFNVGVLAKPSDGLALGASYRHGVRPEPTGSARWTRLATGSSQFDALVAQRLPEGDVPVSTSLALPAVFNAGAQYAWGDWLLAGQLELQRWASFDEITLTLAERPELSPVLRQDFTNSEVYRLGLERRCSDALSLRGGYFLDRTPVPAESLGPLFPDATRHGVTLGATWRHGRMRVDVANAFLFTGARSSEGRSREGYNGSYKSFGDVFSVSVGWWF